jgi:hypothetical protein
MKSRHVVVLAGLCVVGVALAACTASAPAPPEPSPAVPSAPLPTPTTLPTAPASADKVGMFTIETPSDAGGRQYAAGEVELDSAGAPIAYKVASGDIMDFVAERLGLDGIYLVTINQVRRGYTGSLYAGDILNLDPHTITSVGTINGEVLDEEAPSPMPEQR